MHSTSLCLRITTLGALVALTACGTAPPRPVDPVSVADVVSAIKVDLLVAQRYLRWAAGQAAKKNACQGMVSFTLGTVTVELNTLSTHIGSGSVGATVPLEPITVTLGASGSQEMTNTQTIRFVLATQDTLELNQETIDKDPAVNLLPSTYPITVGLRTLREGLLSASDKRPCVAVGPVVSDPKEAKGFEGALVYSFLLDAKSAGEGKVSFLVFSVGGGASNRAQTSNKVSVTFAPTPGSTAWQPFGELGALQ